MRFFSENNLLIKFRVKLFLSRLEANNYKYHYLPDCYINKQANISFKPAADKNIDRKAHK